MYDYWAIDTIGVNDLLFLNEGGEPMEAYCMKCRTKRQMKDTKAITMKNDRPANQGICLVCGTKMFKLDRVKIC